MGLTWLRHAQQVRAVAGGGRAPTRTRRAGIGVRVTGVKVLAFCGERRASTAMVGGVWAYYESFIYPQFAVDPLITIAIVLMTFLGGRATLWGPVLGAFILELGQQYLAYQLGAQPVLPDRVRAGLPVDHAAAAARDPADASGPDAAPRRAAGPARHPPRRRQHAAAAGRCGADGGGASMTALLEVERSPSGSVAYAPSTTARSRSTTARSPG